MRSCAEATSRAIDGLTAGQRWTASLAALLGVVVLAFGMPGGVRSAVDQPAAAQEPASAGSPSGGRAPDQPPSSPPAAAGGPGAAAIAVPALAGSGGPDLSDQAGGSDAPAATGTPAAALGVVALVAPDPAADAATGDAAMARAFLTAAGLDATTVTIGDPAATCKEATAAGGLIISGGHVDDALRRCLTGAGAAVVSFDDGGAVSGGRGAALSTRRGVALSLLDTAERLGPALRGKVALVADERFRDSIESVAGALARRGVAPVATVYLSDGTDAGIDPGAVIGVAGKGADILVFATSVSRQIAFASQYAVVHPGAKLVVADAADSLANQAYPPSFDGALAATAMQYPWTRPDGEAAAVRDRCETTWAATRSTPVPPSTDETARALSWCQEVAIAADLAARSASPGEVVGALRSRALPSPLTTALGPLAAPWTFGPTELTTVTWSAGCRCWGATNQRTAGAARVR
jgi:hypothetical protein